MKLCLDAFTMAYLECALWSSTDNSTPSGGVPLDRNYNILDFSNVSMENARMDCEEFQEKFQSDLEFAGTDNQNGHDFWLTRNGHGAGFWSRGYSDIISKKLTEGAKSYGESFICVGNDGKLYFV